MMKRALFAIGLLLLSAGTGLATPVRYEFSGKISELEGSTKTAQELGIGIGDPFSGFFVYDYDPSLIPESARDPNGVGPDNVYFQEGAFYGIKLGRDNQMSISSYGSWFIMVDDDDRYSGDSLKLYPMGVATNFGPGEDFVISLSDSTKSVFDSIALPPTLDIGKFDSGFFLINTFLAEEHVAIVGRMDQIAQVNGSDSPAPVPEPATLLLLGAGLSGLLLRRKKAA